MIYLIVGIIFFCIITALIVRWTRDHARHEQAALDKLAEIVENKKASER